MSRSTILAVCLPFSIAGQALADCNTTQVQPDTAISALLNNQTVCWIGAGPNAGERRQEWHQMSGTLTEYAGGPLDSLNPTRDVGTWSASGSDIYAVVTYDYGSGSHSWTVHDNGDGSYSFCTAPGGTEVATATLQSGQLPCF